MVRLEIGRVTASLRRNFRQVTSELPDVWTPDRPSIGHCHVASLILHDTYGGYIMRGLVNDDVIHYWNLIDNVWIDVTIDQFPILNSVEHVIDATNEVLNKTTLAKADILLSRTGWDIAKRGL